MRLVRLSDKLKGKKLSQSIKSDTGVTLIPSGSVLDTKNLSKLESLGYSSVYIESELHSQLNDIIDPDTRLECINDFKNLTDVITNFSSKSEKYLNYRDLLQVSASIDNTIKKITSKLLSGLSSSTKLTMVDIKSAKNYLFEHQINVALLSLYIGKLLGMNYLDLSKLAKASLVFDIGNFLIDDEILYKTKDRTEEETKIIESHTTKAFEFLKTNTNLSVTEILPTLQHHERYDGSGYPNGLKGDEIHLYSRIISIADVYDALTSDRPHRKAIPQSEAIEHLMGTAGTRFDYDLINLFIKNIVPYPKGTKVQLSNGALGTIVSQVKDLPLRPKLLITNSNGTNLEGYVNLDTEYNLTIKKVVLE